MKPDDIPPARGVNVIIGVALLPLVGMLLLPIFFVLRYDGLSGVPEWPPVFWGLFAAALLALYTSARLLFSPQKVGAEVAFLSDGFALKVRVFFRKPREHVLVWRDIEKIRLVEAPRGGDFIAFRLTHDAAVREGLIQPTTLESAKSAREVTFPPRLARVSIDDAVARFTTSAEQSGARLEEMSSFNVVVYARKVWQVTWPE